MLAAISVTLYIVHASRDITYTIALIELPSMMTPDHPYSCS